jgi:hypothetical protein
MTGEYPNYYSDEDLQALRQEAGELVKQRNRAVERLLERLKTNPALEGNDHLRVVLEEIRQIDTKLNMSRFSRASMQIEHQSRASGLLPNLAIRDSIERISKADPSDVQRIAGSQLELLAGYHEIVLAQARRSFFWALIGAGIGLFFFLSAVAFVLLTSTAANAVIPLLSGAFVEGVAGVVFFLYGKAVTQLSSFHGRLEILQRYLLANSICESLKGEDQTKARVALIQEISRSSSRADTASVQNSWIPLKTPGEGAG